jgi:hypothetical protein
MNSTSAYVTRQVVPIIVPGLVTALPGQQEAIQIRHSPFGLLHMEIVRPGEAVCQPGSREADIEPKSAITARLAGRDLHLFVEAVEPGVDATRFDSVIILQGADVMGGTVAIVMKDGCAVGSKFLSALDYIHATQMLALYRSNPALRHSGRLDFATLQSLAKRAIRRRSSMWVSCTPGGAGSRLSGARPSNGSSARRGADLARPSSRSEWLWPDPA